MSNDPAELIKTTDVHSARVKGRARAYCDGAPGEPSCHWSPYYAADDREIRQEARNHLKSRPTHEIVVEVADVTRYYVPRRILQEKGFEK